MRDGPLYFYRGILGIDIEGFNRAEWTDPIRARLRSRLYRLVDEALTHADIDSASTACSDAGDGIWLVADTEVSVARLLHPLVTSLASGLADDNRQTSMVERMRLRVVVHAGQMLQDAHGYAGATLNHAARLLDARVARMILKTIADTNLVLLVSEQVYQGVVSHDHTGSTVAATSLCGCSTRRPAPAPGRICPTSRPSPTLPSWQGSRSLPRSCGPWVPARRRLAVSSMARRCGR